ncbi:hypothetical protein ACOQFL_15655 [Actinopolyspora sp. H202]|uniref:hypothetical protein n=1 Tax=Actinopolyspora sp. H202 TaxID=1500456 RepID=UPI003EE6DA96
MERGYDWTGFGVRVRCRDESGSSSLRVWFAHSDPRTIRIDTPTVYNRTEWTVEQAELLRNVLDAALREVGQ